jgi:hypothetical protein
MGRHGSHLMHQIRIRTEVVYPNGGPAYDKYDYFLIKDEDLPDTWKEFKPEDFYDFLNEGGHWNKGWQEITRDHETWIEDNQAEGSQTETAIVVDFINPF